MRTFKYLVAVVIAATLTIITPAPLRAEIYRLGIPMGAASPTYKHLLVALRSEGLVVGENLKIVKVDLSRIGNGADHRIIREEIASNCDLFFTIGAQLPDLVTAGVRTPILFASHNDPTIKLPKEMKENITGFYWGSTESLFTEAVKVLAQEDRQKLGFLCFKGSPVEKRIPVYKKYCREIGVELHTETFSSPEDIGRAIHELKAAGAKAVVILPPALHNKEELSILVGLQDRLKMPLLVSLEEQVEEGAFGGQTVDYDKMLPALANYAKKIFKGRPAGKLPIKRLEGKYVINLAKVNPLGVVIPREIIDQAKIIGIATGNSNHPARTDPARITGNHVIAVPENIPVPILAPLLASLADRGLVEGGNLQLLKVDLSADTSPERMAEITNQLNKKADMFFATGNVLPSLSVMTELKIPVCFVATRETAIIIPKEMMVHFTGVVRASSVGIIDKSLRIFPEAKKIGLIARDDSNLENLAAPYVRQAQQTGITLDFRTFSSTGEIGPLMKEMKAQENDFLLLFPPSVNLEDLDEIVYWQKNLQLPVFGQVLRHIEAGLLAGAIIDQDKITPKLTEYIEKILKGRSPEKLPVFYYEEKYAVNLATAKELDIILPKEIIRSARIVTVTVP